MKINHLLATSCLLILGSATSSFAAYTLTNGDFTTNNTTGWTTSGTGTVSASTGAAVITAGGASNTILRQDFSSGTTATNENYDFQLDFKFSLSTAGATGYNRIRLRGNDYASGADGLGGDLITLRINSGSIDIFDNALNGGFGAFSSALSGITVSAATNYFLRVIGTDFEGSSRRYTLGISSDGTTYTTSGSITAFHTGAGVYKDFESVGFEVTNATSGATLTIDNVTVVPEPGAALLGGLGVLALLRRRRV